jgi:hypothetical protein
MQLPIRVRAKAGVLVPVPRLHGGIARYVGRDIDHDAFARKEIDNEKLYPISKEPTEFSVQLHGHDVFSEIKRAIAHGDLLVELKTPPAPAMQPSSDVQTSAEPRGSRSKG